LQMDIASRDLSQMFYDLSLAQNAIEKATTPEQKARAERAYFELQSRMEGLQRWLRQQY
jgi:hypothetical protein